MKRLIVIAAILLTSATVQAQVYYYGRPVTRPLVNHKQYYLDTIDYYYPVPLYAGPRYNNPPEYVEPLYLNNYYFGPPVSFTIGGGRSRVRVTLR